jgi:hypothetical protein
MLSPLVAVEEAEEVAVVAVKEAAFTLAAALVVVQVVTADIWFRAGLLLLQLAQ